MRLPDSPSIRRFKGHALAACLSLFSALACQEARGDSRCGTGEGEEISISNMAQGDEISYPLLVIQGKLGASATEVKVEAGGKALSWPARAGSYRAMAMLAEGRNTVVISAAGHRIACLEVRHTPNRFGPQVRTLYVTSREAASYGKPADTAGMKQGIRFAALVLQSCMAELFHRAGEPRRTFALGLDAGGQVDARIFLGSKTEAEYRELDASGPFGAVETGPSLLREAEAAFAGQEDLKLLALSALEQAGPQTNRQFAFITAASLGEWPRSLDELARLARLNAQGLRSPFASQPPGNAYAGAVGAMLQRLSHAFGLESTGRENDLMRLGTADYAEAGGLFLLEPCAAGATGPRGVELGDTSLASLKGSRFVRGPQTPMGPWPTVNKASGLNYAYFEGEFKTFPIFDSLRPIAEGMAHEPSLAGIGDAAGMERGNLVFTGYINVPRTSEYGFHFSSDQGIRLFIDRMPVVANEAGERTLARAGSIALQSGCHRFRLEYLGRRTGVIPALGWEAEGMARVPVPASAFSHEAAPAPPLSVKAPGLHPRGTAGRLILTGPGHASLAVVSPSGKLLRYVFSGLLPEGATPIDVPAGYPPGSLGVWSQGGKAGAFPLHRLQSAGAGSR